MNQASKVFVVCLSIVVGTISVAEGATPKFRPATPFDPVIGRYLVTLDSSVPDDTAELSAESLAHA